MTRKEIIKQKLSALNPQFLEIIDQSRDHIGHVGNINPSGESHFQLTISATSLEHLSKIEQHRLINNLLRDEFTNGLHALSINIE